MFFHYWNAKVGSQEIPGVTGKFGFAVQNEAGQRLMEFCQENALVITNTCRGPAPADPGYSKERRLGEGRGTTA